MSATEQQTQVHGGRLVARRLKAHGVTKLFTLSGGHLFSIYDGCREEGIDIVDVRHEQAAAFAAEGWAKVTREPGVAALTAGPGVTNGMSAMGSAQKNHSPMLVLGGRAPAMRWGQGSLQEIDHVPFVRAADEVRRDAGLDRRDPGARRRRARAPRWRRTPGPTFVDFPLDYVFMEAEVADAGPGRARRSPARRRRRALERAVALLRRRRAAGDHGRHEPLLGPRRGRAAARSREELRHPGLPQRPRRAAACPPTTSCSSRARAATA